MLIAIVSAGFLFLAIAACGIVLVFRPRDGGFLHHGWRAFGWLALWVAPMALVQIGRWVIGTPGMSMDLGSGLLFLPFAWMVLFGGQSVIHLFEQNVEAWTGHRQATMFDNMPVFFSLTLIQGILLCWLVARRFHQGKSLRDPLVLGLGIFMAINAALGVPWPWSGS